MVPADDESTSTNESEEDTSTRGTFFERFKFWKRDKKDANEPARLKTLPQYLMHWTTPVWIAAAGFLIALAFAVNWRGTIHWPSADAMKLCATIAGAGFAFSAWQQRSHDNAVRDDDKLDRERAADRVRAEREEQRSLEETRRLEQIERDEYWKRREHIFQLLGSKNPGLRLGAVALLAELADSAAHSTLLNETEKQELQRHIINTLGLQMRQEGLLNLKEGHKEDHIEIQRVIFESIVTRINTSSQRSGHADWSTERIPLHDCRILTPISFINMHTNAEIDLSNSILESFFFINKSRIENLLWADAKFHQTIQVNDNRGEDFVRMDSLPKHPGVYSFINSNLIFMYTDPIIHTNNSIDTQGTKTTYFRGCDFFKDTLTFSRSNSTKLSKLGPHKEREGLTRASIYLYDEIIETSNDIPAREITIRKCRLESITLDISSPLNDITITDNTIFDFIEIRTLGAWNQVYTNIHPDYSHPPLSIRNNTFTTTTTSLPARLLSRRTIHEDQLVNFADNYIINPDEPQNTLPLQLEHCILIENEDA